MKDLTTWAQALHERRDVWHDERVPSQWDVLFGSTFDDPSGGDARDLPIDSLHTMRRAGEIDDATFEFVSRFDPADFRDHRQPFKGNAYGRARHRTVVLLWADNVHLLNWCERILRPVLAGQPCCMQNALHGDDRNARWFRLRAVELGISGRPSLAEWLVRRTRGGSIVSVGDDEWIRAKRAIETTRFDLYAMRLCCLRATHTGHGRSLRVLECPFTSAARPTLFG